MTHPKDSTPPRVLQLHHTTCPPSSDEGIDVATTTPTETVYTDDLPSDSLVLSLAIIYNTILQSTDKLCCILPLKKN